MERSPARGLIDETIYENLLVEKHKATVVILKDLLVKIYKALGLDVRFAKSSSGSL